MDVKAIYTKYPRLFQEEPICGFSCGDGWFDILTKLFDDITDILEKADIEEEDKYCPIDQVKEKFGTLRVYPGSTPESLYSIISDRIGGAEEESSKTCESCGSLGLKRSRGWIKIRCDKCQEIYEEKKI
jgi:hypothetical protein